MSWRSSFTFPKRWAGEFILFLWSTQQGDMDTQDKDEELVRKSSMYGWEKALRPEL